MPAASTGHPGTGVTGPTSTCPPCMQCDAMRLTVMSRELHCACGEPTSEEAATLLAAACQHTRGRAPCPCMPATTPEARRSLLDMPVGWLLPLARAAQGRSWPAGMSLAAYLRRRGCFPPCSGWAYSLPPVQTVSRARPSAAFLPCSWPPSSSQEPAASHTPRPTAGLLLAAMHGDQSSLSG